MPLYTQRQFIILLSLLLPVMANAKKNVCIEQHGGASNCAVLPNGDVVLKCYHGAYIMSKRDRSDWKVIRSTCKSR